MIILYKFVSCMFEEAVTILLLNFVIMITDIVYIYI